MTIAYWCVLVVILLPYVWFGFFAGRVGAARDNNQPRAVMASAEGPALRALGAHQNSFEASIGFIAAVIVAELAHAPQSRIDLLALIFVAARIAYGVLYLAGLGALRSLAFFVGLLCTIGLFVISAMGGGAAS
jgi:uncharacterized MAPEG superfamily protein